MTKSKKTIASKKALALWVAIVLTVLVVGGYILMRADGGYPPASPLEKVTIAYSATPDAVLAEVAQVQDYYSAEGLDVTPHRQPYGKLALQEVLDGRADFATVAETPIMFAIMNGERISVIASIQTSHKSNAIIARKDKGIRTPEDLKHRKIAATSGTTSHFFLDAFLVVNEVSKEDVEVIDLKPEELQIALLNGSVDAASVFQTHITSLQNRLGNRGIIFYDENIYTQTFNIVAKQEYIRKNPETVKKVIRALLKAEEFIRQDPVEAQENISDFSGIDKDVIRKIWGNNEFSVKLDQSLLLAMEDESEWAINNKLTPKKEIPNYLDFIYFDGLKSVKPEAIRMLN
jgi:sulfonate transport system substrate-binding protein